jgi:hypothetical protein
VAGVYCDKYACYRGFGDGVRMDNFIVGIVAGDWERKD